MYKTAKKQTVTLAAYSDAGWVERKAILSFVGRDDSRRMIFGSSAASERKGVSPCFAFILSPTRSKKYRTSTGESWSALSADDWSGLTADGWGTLTSTSGSYRNAFTYDPTGNRLVKNASGAITTSTYDVANQQVISLDSSGTTTYSFNADGNQVLTVAPNGDRTTTTWDYENKTTLIQLPSGPRNTMAYDPDGLRVAGWHCQERAGTGCHAQLHPRLASLPGRAAKNLSQ